MKTIGVLLILMFSIGCNKKDNKKAEAEAVIMEWMGKTIVFPEGIPCRYQGRDTVFAGTDAPCKVLVYIDSTGCTSCRLGIDRWKMWMAEYEQEVTEKVEFLFYFQPKSERELRILLKRDRFEHPVYIDVAGELNRINQFPKNEQYHCFLLDRDNRVLLVGNPTRNRAVGKLYKKVIDGDLQEDKRIQTTTIKVENDHLKLPSLKKGETTEVSFVIKNTGMYDLDIETVLSSCDCVSPEWELKPVPPGESATLIVKIKPESAGHFEWEVAVFCNIDGHETKLRIDGFVREQEPKSIRMQSCLPPTIWKLGKNKFV